MFNNKFWSKRKSVIDKNKANIEIEESREINKEKKSKKNSNLFYKFKKSFVKAKSMDHTDVIKIEDGLHKHSFDNIAEPIKMQKSNGRSLRRIFSSNKQKLDAVASGTDTVVNTNRIDKIDTIRTSTITNWEKCNVPSNNKTSLRNKSPLPGIINHGNTCYINSVIQCLNSIDSLVQYFVLDEFKPSLTENNSVSPYTQPNIQIQIKNKDNMSLLLSFSSLLKSLWQKDLNCNILSNDFKIKLAATEKSFRSNDQQDAQEFLLYLLNYCHEILKLPSIDKHDYNQTYIRYKEVKYNLSSEAENISQQNRSIIHKLFVTHQQLTITCPGCSSRQYKLEPHLCLSLPVPAKTMEPLYYCFIEKDGSQICAAMWINTISLVQYVRANIAHKFRIDVCRVIIMLINESGFGKYFQDSEQAVDLISCDNSNQNVSNLWNGVVALEIPSVMSNSSCYEYDYFDSKIYQKTVRQVKGTTSPIRRTNSSNVSGITRRCGNYDNFNFEEKNTYDSQSTKEDSNSQSHLRYDSDDYQRSNVLYPNNSSNSTTLATDSVINLVITHVEEIFEKSYASSWRRFSAPVSVLVRKEIEFKDLEKMVISQLEGVYHCSIQSKLKAHLRFLVWDGLSNIDSEITCDHQFPLLTEAVESIVSWSEDINIIRMVCVWSPSNGARLMQTVFANLRLSHSLGREVTKFDLYNGGSNSQSLSLMDAWSSIEENGSVELVMRATLSKRSQLSDSRNISLEDCLKAYVSEEILDAKDAWKCPNCRKFQRATISNSIYSLPDILVLHLKRFQSYSLSFNCGEGKGCRDHEDIALTTVGGNNSHSHNGSLIFENNSNNKLNILVDYPLSGLDMKSYLSADAIINSPKKVDPSEYYYDLIAVCNHQGTLSTGHYTAFCRSSVDYKWRLFNDDVVREVLADKVIQPNAYILFYQRRSSIKCSDQHWSSFLTPMKPEDYIKTPSPQSLKVAPTLESRKQTNFNKISEMKQMQRKSDPPIRRAPYQNKTNSEYQINNSKVNFQPLSLPRLLTLDNNCTSIRNNTPIVDDDEDDDNTSQGSTSYDEYIPTSVTKKLLTLQMKSHDNNLRLNPSKSH